MPWDNTWIVLRTSLVAPISLSVPTDCQYEASLIVISAATATQVSGKTRRPRLTPVNTPIVGPGQEVWDHGP